MGTILGGALTLVGLALLTGCFSPAAPACALACAQDDACPAGLVCNGAGLCAPEGQSCTAAVDSGAAGSCDLLAGLADDFEDDVIDEDRWRSYTHLSGQLREQNGQLVFELPADEPEIQVAGVISRASFPLDGFDLRARVRYADEMASLSLQLHGQSDDRIISMVANPGTLKMLSEGADQQGSDMMSWNAAEQPWWRMREDGGEIVFFVSSDGERWRRSGEVSTESFGAQAFVELSGFADTTADSARYIGFHEIGPMCP